MSETAISAQAAGSSRLSEDALSVVIGLVVVALAFLSLAGVDWLGWLVTASVWTDPSKALAPASKGYASLGGVGSLILTYVVLTAVLSAGVYALGDDVKRFAIRFTIAFAIAYASWFIGSSAYLAAVTPADQAKFGVAWSLRLTNEGGYIVALLAGLAIANFSPSFAEWLKAAIRPELYIKIAIVILGAFIAVTAASKLNLASSLLLRGVAAIIEAYLIYWPIVYLIARKGFRLQPGMVGAARFGGLDLRRRRGHRHRRRHPRPAASAGARLFAGRRLRRHRSAGAADHRGNLHVA